MTTGITVIRQALAARIRKGHAVLLARELQVGVAALEAFATGTGQLPPAVLQALCTILYHGHATYDPQLDRLRPAPKPATQVFAPARPPSLDPKQLPTYRSGRPVAGPQPHKPVAQPQRQPRPGWAD